jgi:BirA family biotin operon repressor/biotin-[acetyl-CoA-carboxylase] ligase
MAPPRSSVIVSVLLRPVEPPAARLGWLPLLAGLAVAETVRRQCGVQAVLKWPNDVLLPMPDGGDLRKACGVLAEMVSTPDGPAVVLGVGLNVSQDQGELPVDTATSLRLAGAATLDRDTILRAYLRALAVRYRAWTDALGDPRGSGVGPAYRDACATLGTLVEVHLPSGETVRGAAQEVDDDGRLVVLDGDTPRALAAGDVIHVRPPKA